MVADIRSGIIQTAQALGINPLDLATTISYETAGTFDPAKRGPTTQWGQHRGLIQFGEPQARQYGVDWTNPIGSQLGENGAVAKYLRGAGVKPGMGLLDLYSAVNAGRVGRYNASDANNGGAPGTVRDKVNNQMAGHRQKASALLGGSYALSPTPMSQQTAGNPQPFQPAFGDIVAPTAVGTVPVPPAPAFGDYLVAQNQNRQSQREVQAAEQQANAQRLAALFGDGLFGIYG